MRTNKRRTKQFTWASPQNCGKIDLKNYTKAIDSAVNEVIPDEFEPFVDVQEDNFIINTAYKIPNDMARQLGRIIAQTPDIGELYKNYGNSNQIFRGRDIT